MTVFGDSAGSSSIAFVTGEPVDAAKALRDFAKANQALVIKGGFMDGNALSVDEVNRIADLESREVLLAKLAGAMVASLSQAAALFQAPLSKAARTLDYGGVLVNEVPTFRADQQPYGGNRDSGNTREGPQWAVREMTEERLIIIQM